ncbi:DEAD/DEAH box helicase [Roseovarius mucosus]|uniref:DEAD/DEAH box helicase n=1 Tax=Roseovarius mucosus TaxID=215743 RepID=A0A1V0RRK4_9RHOB|nr:DEAD/DEAH box helicase family protein [Roseovarius mucosus]ARE84408.1 DEAD/DEAH box helicase [Roseovarius mucosus]
MKDAIHVTYGQTGNSQQFNTMGMRPMQARVFAKRDEQYILVKAPPASGKSRALMFLGLDKLHNQGIRKVIVAVPEKSIGSSFKTTMLKEHGFFSDWIVPNQWNLCLDVGTLEEGAVLEGKVNTLKSFLDERNQEPIIVCTHSTLRAAFKKFSLDIFDNCLIAVDEFHHASSGENNRLGEVVRDLIKRGSAHIVAMTGSYFRGDAVMVLDPEDEARFTSVSYTYYEQLNGYKYLKSLGIGYHFYSGRYTKSIGEVLDPSLKTIIHIPHIMNSASSKDKYREVHEILSFLGEYQGVEEETGFHRIFNKDLNRILKVADLVEDAPELRLRTQAGLRDTTNRDKVDVIIALNLAKEGFDWIWCEHALTVGYRGSLTEIIQIIGRATRDAPSKKHAQFTNLVPEPDATQSTVTSAVNDLLKAISASLLMQQVLAPKFKFRTKRVEDEDDASEDMTYDETTGEITVAIKGYKEPTSENVKAIINNDINELIGAICQDPEISSQATADPDIAAERVNVHLIPKVIEEKFEHLNETEVEELRQHVVAQMNIIGESQNQDLLKPAHQTDEDDEPVSQGKNLGLMKLVRKFINVQELDIDLIDQINPFRSAYEILSKDLNTTTLAQINSAITTKTIRITEVEAARMIPKLEKFIELNSRPPSSLSENPSERYLGQVYDFFLEMKRKRAAEK